MFALTKSKTAWAAALAVCLAGAPPVLAEGSSPSESEATQRDPRADDEVYQRSQKLLKAIDDILADAAEERAKARDLPSQDTFILPPLWSDTREDNEERVRALLDSALEIVTDAPIVQMQGTIAERRAAIDQMRDEITELKQERLSAPEGGWMPGVLTDTRGSIDDAIKELERRIAENRAVIEEKKAEIHNALEDAGIKIAREQLDLLLDSVLGGDLLKLVAAFEAASGIDRRLGELLDASTDNPKTARRYFAMHASLFAMLLHAQDSLIEKIDGKYMVKLQAILTDIRQARKQTYRLLAGENRPDQQRALDANLKAQNFAEKAAGVYKDYLEAQRKQLVEARKRTIRDLRIADNTYRTVEASFQLRALMQNSRATFEAIRRLEAPGFERIFRNESLRKEFEQLTRELAPSS
jgi:protein tyrosine phosphatase (PTP) superfamily phosphohydrolase (DUF442 family)/uncharacterized coiled-coil protein SlyX